MLVQLSARWDEQYVRRRLDDPRNPHLSVHFTAESS
jgi:hypothetical protein